MRKTILIFFLAVGLYGDPKGLAEALSLAGATAPEIEAAANSLALLNSEIKTTVELNRKILQSEITRNIIINEKLYWIQKAKKNMSRLYDIESISVQMQTANNKIWIFNNSLIFLHYSSSDYTDKKEIQ